MLMCKGIAAQSRNMTGLLPSRVTGAGDGRAGRTRGCERERERTGEFDHNVWSSIQRCFFFVLLIFFFLKTAAHFLSQIVVCEPPLGIDIVLRSDVECV